MAPDTAAWENVRKGVALFGVEGSSIDWKDYKNVRGTAYTTINGEFAQFAVTRSAGTGLSAPSVRLLYGPGHRRLDGPGHLLHGDLR